MKLTVLTMPESMEKSARRKVWGPMVNITWERSISPSTKRFSASSALWASFTETKATRIMVRAEARVPMAKTSRVPRANQW